jgi:hypothetical protein
MGAPISTYVTFKERPPALSCIAQRITEISGLPVSVAESADESRDGFFESKAFISFKCAPKDRIEVRASDVRPIVGLRDLSGPEPTLWNVTILALEALGRSQRPSLRDKTRQKYSVPISQSQFLRRRRLARVKLLLASPLYILLVPVTLSIWVGWWLLNLPSDAVGKKWWSRTRNGRL